MASKGKLYIYFDAIFGKWSTSITTFILLIIGAILLNYGLKNRWIDQTFGVELLFFVIGILLGRLIEKWQEKT